MHTNWRVIDLDRLIKGQGRWDFADDLIVYAVFCSKLITFLVFTSVCIVLSFSGDPP